MSIRPRRRLTVDEPAKPEQDRRPERVEEQFLMPSTRNWLETLPKGVRPIHLQRLFPRICNGIQRRWKSAPDVNAYLAEKEMSDRPDRLGFPPLIKEELLAIRVHWMRQQAARAAALRASASGASVPDLAATG